MNNEFLINNKKLNPFFSVISVVKNDDKNISKTIESIKSQSFKDFEYIIIDGKSTDNTVQGNTKIQQFCKSIN